MMTKRLPRPRDPIQFGKLIVDIATGQVQEPEDTVELLQRTELPLLQSN